MKVLQTQCLMILYNLDIRTRWYIKIVMKWDNRKLCHLMTLFLD